MIIYKSERPRGTFYFLKRLAIYLLVFGLPFIYIRIYEPYNTFGWGTYIFVLIIYLVKSWIENADITSISEIHFDTTAREVIFYRVRIFSKKQKRIFSFDDLKLHVQSYMPGISPSRQALVLTFRKKEEEVVVINAWKDGFSRETIARIWRAAGTSGLNLTVRYRMMNGNNWSNDEESA